MIVAVLDVNVVISAVLGALGFSRQVVESLRAGRFVAATSAGIIAEVEAKLRLPRISRRYHLTDQDVAWAVDLLTSFTRVVIVPAHEVHPVTGDPEDDLVLATGRLARADYLVTGDRGLLALGSYAGMAIVTPREFMSLLETDRARAGQ
jgi:putative PIN family toxin of toxin-antitoxin system